MQNHIRSPTRILVIEDDLAFAHLLLEQLAELPSDVITANDGLQGLTLAQSESWSLIVLNARLPKLSGIEICKRLRLAQSDVPICMISSDPSELDRILGLEMGADDYMSKPLSVAELRARIRAILRRPRLATCETNEGNDLHIEGKRSDTRQKMITAGDLSLDSKTRRAYLRGRLIALTPREWDLLWLLAEHAGEAFTRSELLDKVWGISHDGFEHTVNSHINRLRAKLIEGNGAQLIQTIWGTGYRLVNLPNSVTTATSPNPPASSQLMS